MVVLNYLAGAHFVVLFDDAGLVFRLLIPPSVRFVTNRIRYLNPLSGLPRPDVRHAGSECRHLADETSSCVCFHTSQAYGRSKQTGRAPVFRIGQVSANPNKRDGQGE